MTDGQIKCGILIFFMMFLFYLFSDYLIYDSFIDYNINGKIYKVLDKDTNSIDAAIILQKNIKILII